MSVIASVAVNSPAAAGLNSTPILQVFPAAIAPTQVFDAMVNEVGSAPPTATELKETASVPVLVSVMVFGPDEVPSTRAGKVNVVALKATLATARILNLVSTGVSALPATSTL